LAVKLHKKILRIIWNSFFFDGESINRKLIPLFLDRVNSLLRAVEPLKGFRYYSSSLLFLYDGASTSKNTVEPKVRVTMIDFAHTYCNESKALENGDDGYVFGLNNLKKLLENLIKNEPSKRNEVTKTS